MDNFQLSKISILKSGVAKVEFQDKNFSGPRTGKHQAHPDFVEALNAFQHHVASIAGVTHPDLVSVDYDRFKEDYQEARKLSQSPLVSDKLDTLFTLVESQVNKADNDLEVTGVKLIDLEGDKPRVIFYYKTTFLSRDRAAKGETPVVHLQDDEDYANSSKLQALIDDLIEEARLYIFELKSAQLEMDFDSNLFGQVAENEEVEDDFFQEEFVEAESESTEVEGELADQLEEEILAQEA